MLSSTGRGEDGFLIISQDFEPTGDIGSVVDFRVGGELKLGADKGGRELGDEFFPGVSFGAESSGEIAVESLRSAAPVGKFVREDGIILVGGLELGEVGDLDEVGGF